MELHMIDQSIKLHLITHGNPLVLQLHASIRRHEYI